MKIAKLNMAMLASGHLARGAWRPDHTAMPQVDKRQAAYKRCCRAIPHDTFDPSPSPPPSTAIYDGMKDAFQPSQAPAGFEARYRFEVADDEAGPGARFNVDIRNSQACFWEGPVESRPTLTFRMTRSTFEALRSGELSGMRGFLSGAVEVVGVNKWNIAMRVPDLRKFDALFPSGSYP